MRKTIFFTLIVGALLVAAVGPVYGQPAAQETTRLRMGLLPILDVLPFYVAQEAGYFDEANLEVELVPVSSALERDQLLLAGEIDGMLNDLISTGIFNQDKVRIQVVAQARRAYPEAPQFRILAAPGSEIISVADLAGVEIGISENSIIYYIAQRIMEDAGLTVDDMRFRPEPNIPVRFQLLMEGALQAACLPDPLAQAAIENGAILVADDTALIEQEFSQSVLSFRTEVIEDSPEAVEAFLSVWMRAAAEVNAAPDDYRDLWIENTSVPESVRDSYELPPFPLYAVPQALAWNDTMAWLVDEDIIDSAPVYGSSVNADFMIRIAPIEEVGALSGGDAENGAALFANNGCIGCHSVDQPVPMVGPSMMGLALEVGSRVEDQNALDYLHLAIVEPSNSVADGFSNGVMPPYDALPESDVNDLIAYILTLK